MTSCFDLPHSNLFNHFTPFFSCSTSPPSPAIGFIFNDNCNVFNSCGRCSNLIIKHRDVVLKTTLDKMASVASYHCVPSVDLHCPLSYFHRVEELQENSCCDISKEKRPKEFCFCVYDTYLYSVCTSIFDSSLKRVIVMRDTLLKTAITP